MSMSLSPWNDCCSEVYLRQSAGHLYRTFQIFFTFSPLQSDRCALTEITSGSSCHPALFCFCFLISNTNQVCMRENWSIKTQNKKQEKLEKVKKKQKKTSTSPPLSSHVSFLCPICTNVDPNLKINAVSEEMTHSTQRRAAEHDDS